MGRIAFFQLLLQLVVVVVGLPLLATVKMVVLVAVVVLITL